MGWREEGSKKVMTEGGIREGRRERAGDAREGGHGLANPGKSAYVCYDLK